MFLQKLQEGGASDELWTREAMGLVDHWRATTEKKNGEPVSFSPVCCYRQGCTVTIRYLEQSAFDQHSWMLLETDVLRQWPGARWRSGPVVTQEGVAATWILFAPPPAVEEHELPAEGDMQHPDYKIPGE
jgi:hypothetical protein